jgi:F0F1-type ATP synthase membrane subunit c/vacuolar-type H+-ATPase subunit K
MVSAAFFVVAAISICTWLAISARDPSKRPLYRRVLLVAAIVSTVGLIGMLALAFVLVRTGPNSPAGMVPALFAIPCAFVAVPSWIGFLVQARLTKR